MPSDVASSSSINLRIFFSDSRKQNSIPTTVKEKLEWSTCSPFTLEITNFNVHLFTYVTIDLIVLLYFFYILVQYLIRHLNYT